MCIFSNICTNNYRDEKIKSINNIIYNDFRSKETEQENYINNKIDKIVSIYEKQKTEYINKKLKNLYEYRINHYNISIENIFYNSGLIAECESDNLYFQKIEKKNIIKEGTTEDYFFYFNSYSSLSK